MSVVSRACPQLRAARREVPPERVPADRALERRGVLPDARAWEAVRVREEDARDVDRRPEAVFPAFADALFCVRAAAIGAQSVV